MYLKKEQEKPNVSNNEEGDLRDGDLVGAKAPKRDVPDPDPDNDPRSLSAALRQCACPEFGGKGFFHGPPCKN